MLYIKGVTVKQRALMQNAILSPDALFDAELWDKDTVDLLLDDSFSRRVITDIDAVDVLSTKEHTFDLLLKERLHPSFISTGAKNLILCKFYEVKPGRIIYFCLGRMGGKLL